ncbi:heterokaryon incompatibility protein-domain-containing protein [Hyaloscypha finlandica]|nr:heterokaryon incompatibility protein-domain-containing protein [Hyaloscypha finlandica]
MSESGLSRYATLWPEGRQGGIARPARITNDKPYVSSYRYKPLDTQKNEIRLLTIEPLTPVSLIKCQIQTVSLDNAPPYQALSYAWGHGRGYRNIYLQGYLYSVTENLAAALRQLSRPGSGVRPIWIDAICINQQDPRERNHQVNKMRAIYEQAECVIIWLGPADEHSSRALALSRSLVLHEEVQQDSSQLINDPKRRHQFRGFQMLLQRPYWSRVWVIQEVNSAKKGMVMCGQDSVAWTDLLRAQNIINSNRSALWRLATDDPLLSGIRPTIWADGPRGLLPHIKNHDPSLFEALTWHSDKLSSLPEDKVYALLGITTARDDPRIVVDYNKDWVNAYPSPLSDGSLDKFYAAGTSKASTVIESDGALLAKGFCLGDISFAGPNTIRNTDRRKEKVFALCDDFHRSRSILGHKKVSLEKLLRLCKNFTCGRIPEEPQVLMRELKEDTQRIILGLLAFLDPKPGVPLGRDLARLAAELLEKSNRSDVERLGQSVLRDLVSIVEFRRFFVCSNGLQGSAYEDAIVGCKVCILFGCATPVVLKPVGNLWVRTSFNVLGDAYVDGYMNGEGMKELEQGQYQLTEFVII